MSSWHKFDNQRLTSTNGELMSVEPLRENVCVWAELADLRGEQVLRVTCEFLCQSKAENKIQCFEKSLCQK